MGRWRWTQTCLETQWVKCVGDEQMELDGGGKINQVTGSYHKKGDWCKTWGIVERDKCCSKPVIFSKKFRTCMAPQNISNVFFHTLGKHIKYPDELNNKERITESVNNVVPGLYHKSGCLCPSWRCVPEEAEADGTVCFLPRKTSGIVALTFLMERTALLAHYMHWVIRQCTI